MTISVRQSVINATRDPDYESMSNMRELLAFINGSPLVERDDIISALSRELTSRREALAQVLEKCREYENRYHHARATRDNLLKVRNNAVDRTRALRQEHQEKIFLSGGQIDRESAKLFNQIAESEDVETQTEAMLQEAENRLNGIYAASLGDCGRARLLKSEIRQIYAEMEARKFFLVVGGLIRRVFSLAPSGNEDKSFDIDIWDKNSCCDIFSSLNFDEVWDNTTLLPETVKCAALNTPLPMNAGFLSPVKQKQFIDQYGKYSPDI